MSRTVGIMIDNLERTVGAEENYELLYEFYVKFVEDYCIEGGDFEDLESNIGISDVFDEVLENIRNSHIVVEE